MNAPPQWMTDQDIDRLVPLDQAIDAIRELLVAEARGEAHGIPKTLTTWEPTSAAHALGGYDGSTARAGFKTWVNTPDGAEAVLSLFDSANGKLLALMQAVTLGVIRTAATAGVATDLLAASDADEMALIGSGRQALRQVAAVDAVRPLRRVRVWSRNEDSAKAMVVQINQQLGRAACAVTSLEEAVVGAPIVTLITRAREPFFPRGILAPGAHLNALGAILPQAAEFDSSLLADAAVTAVDDRANAEKNSRELRERFGEDFSSVITLGDLLNGSAERPADPQLTVYKGMGMGLADLAVAALAVRISEVPA